MACSTLTQRLFADASRIHWKGTCRWSFPQNWREPIVIGSVGMQSLYCRSIAAYTLWNVRNIGLELSAWLFCPNIFFAALVLFTTMTGIFPSWIWYTSPYILDCCLYFSAALNLISGMFPTSSQFVEPMNSFIRAARRMNSLEMR